MFSYCVHVLHLSEQAAFKRIRVARTARQFPAIFTAVAKGHLHLSGVLLLTPHLTRETVDEWRPSPRGPQRNGMPFVVGREAPAGSPR